MSSDVHVVPDKCEGCGACCTFFDAVPIADIDVARLPKGMVESSRARLVDKGEPSHFKLKMNKLPNGNVACAAYDLEKKICTVYDVRPSVCRDFTRDCHLCRAATLWVKKGSVADAKFNCSVEVPKVSGDRPLPPQGWDERRDYTTGARRFVIDGKAGPWRCPDCLVHASKARDIRHSKGCFYHSEMLRCISPIVITAQKSEKEEKAKCE